MRRARKVVAVPIRENVGKLRCDGLDAGLRKFATQTENIAAELEKVAVKQGKEMRGARIKAVVVSSVNSKALRTSKSNSTQATHRANFYVLLRWKDARYNYTPVDISRLKFLYTL